ncbi:hypothetical protein P8605_09515 [Streptomyces sp. T-3]|nr:hypothetical protein [Streptomyces sp. T-3]
MAGIRSRRSRAVRALPVRAPRRLLFLRCVAVLALLAGFCAAGPSGTGERAAAAPRAVLRDVTQEYFYAALDPVTSRSGVEDLELRFAYEGAGGSASDAGIAGELEVDATGLAGVARVKGGADGCAGRAGTPVFTCPKQIIRDPEGWNSSAIAVVPVPGAEPGDSGELRYSLRALDGSLQGKGSITVIAGRPELVVSEGRAKAVARGESFTFPLFIRNVGDVPTRGGVELTVSSRDDLVLQGRHSNCRYPKAGTSMACRVEDAVIQPGRTVRVSPDERLTPLPEAVDSRIGYTAGPYSTGDARGIEGASPLEPGTGTPLKLVPAEPDAKSVRFTEEASPMTSAGLDVAVGNTADFEAFGGSFSGDVGTEHGVEIGFVNHGPADPRTGKTSAVFKVPPGTKVVEAPYDFERDEEMLPQLCLTQDKGRTYTCKVHPKPGERYRFAFRLLIEHKDSRPGSVTVSHRLGDNGPDGERHLPDPVPDNDTAPVKVTATGEEPPATNSGPGPAFWASVAGGAAVVAAAGVVLVRRRREG